MRQLFIILLLGCTCTNLIGQDSLSTNRSLPNYLLKLNVGSIINTSKASVMLGANLFLSNKWNLELEAGSFVGSAYFNQFKGERYTGPRVKFSANRTLDINRSNFWTFGPMIKWHYITHKTYRSSIEQGGNFQRVQFFDRTIQALGAGMKTSFLCYLGKKDQYIFEISSGLGGLYLDVRSPFGESFEVDTRTDRFIDFAYGEGRQFSFDFYFSIYFAYVLR